MSKGEEVNAVEMTGKSPIDEKHVQVETEKVNHHDAPPVTPLQFGLIMAAEVGG